MNKRDTKSSLVGGKRSTKETVPVLRMAKSRLPRFFRRRKKVIFAFLLLLALNTLAASLFHSFLGEGRSQAGLLSDLLFIEGAVIFVFGAFATSVKTSKDTRREPQLEEESSEDVSKSSWRTDFWILMIIGAALIGLSIAIGLLLL